MITTTRTTAAAGDAARAGRPAPGPGDSADCAAGEGRPTFSGWSSCAGDTDVIDFAHREAPKTKHRVATFGGVLQYATVALRDFERRAEAPAVRETAGTEARRARRESEARVREFWQSLPPEQRAALEAEALAGAAPAARAECEAAAAPVRRLLLVGLRDALIRQRLGLPAAD